MPHVDFTGLSRDKTLSFTLSDKSGRIVRWEVPPFDNLTEHAYWEWSDQMFEQRKLEQDYQMGLLKDEEDRPAKPVRMTVAETWAPLICLAVKRQGESEDTMVDVHLQEDELMENYHTPILTAVGSDIASFFLTGKTQGQEREEREMAEKAVAAFQPVAMTGSTTSAKSASGSRKRSTKS